MSESAKATAEQVSYRLKAACPRCGTEHSEMMSGWSIDEDLRSNSLFMWCDECCETFDIDEVEWL